MRKKILATINKYEMLCQDDKVVLAISGGVDSMVMLHLFIQLVTDFNLEIIIAHLNHGIRAESELDLALVQEVAKQNNIVLEHDLLPPDNRGGNFHGYAREYRYEFLARIANKYGATKIATAHHAHDQLETMVMRMMQTTKPASLIGIKPVSNRAGLVVIRPLIDATKADIESFARTNAVAYLEDCSNQSEVYLRNRIRKKIIPLLEAEQPDVLGNIRQLAENLNDDEQYFAEIVAQLLTHVTIISSGYQFDFSWFAALHPSLKRRLITNLIPHVTQRAYRDLTEWLATKPPTGSLDIGSDMVVKKVYQNVLIERLGTKTNRNMAYEYELAVGVDCVLPDGQKLILRKNCEKKGSNGTYLCYNSTRMPFYVRTRRAGDRIGSVKVKKLMIDAKIPVDKRSNWPILTDANGEIIWIPGLKKSPLCRAVPNSEHDLWVELV